MVYGQNVVPVDEAMYLDWAALLPQVVQCPRPIIDRCDYVTISLLMNTKQIVYMHGGAIYQLTSLETHCLVNGGTIDKVT